MVERRNCIGIVKMAAILLIINSHIEAIYPNGLKFISSGGAIGNSIFFIISGFFLHISGGIFEFIKKKPSEYILLVG